LYVKPVTAQKKIINLTYSILRKRKVEISTINTDMNYDLI